ncbi:MAG: polymer-forming cytoskeletal protein [Candidatus Dadabacteria bacterium]|nr:MAG: polymer-forming cytoskeletal protein [Candidatus Dadabacteria bacterium]
MASRYGKLRSALGAGTVIQGKLSFDTAVRIDGKLSGEVFSTSALIVGKSGSIDANIEVDSLIVLGSVKGSVKAKERVELLAGGSLEGDLTAPVLVVEEGARLSGDCRMNSAPKIPAPQPKKEIEQEAKALKDKKAKASSSADKAGEKAQEVRVH